VDQIVPEHPDLAPYADAMRDWTHQTQRAVVEWIVTMREGHALAQAHPDRVLHIPYEALCADAGNWMPQITRFCDLPDDAVTLSFAESRLHPVAPKAPFDLDPCLTAPFHDTMALLGYAGGRA